MPLVFISLGSNVGHRLGYLLMAKESLQRHPHFSIQAWSPICETAPVGYIHQSNFLNQVIQLYTLLSPTSLLFHLQVVERICHRQHTFRWGPRTLDVDILTYGTLSFQSSRLTLPHPELSHRPFLQEAIQILNPSFVIPKS